MTAPAYATQLNRSERVLGWATLVLLAVVGIAVLRGHAHWPGVRWTVWLHLATMMTALALTPAILWLPRGTRRHRRFGYAWVVALLATALDSFLIRDANHGQLGFIHILSAWVLIQVPLIVWTARTHRHARHRRAVRAMVIGALLTAGVFTLPFGRMLGTWLSGG
ncbi:hypothetical protein [Novosphingobium lentum]|uniref:hypothetical protein n=1 Tax=Novosphingobium lentum TaxID=145287 RepID=UPI00082A07E3|nr:hypothetical protein [Novosphingobium lentum]